MILELFWIIKRRLLLRKCRRKVKRIGNSHHSTFSWMLLNRKLLKNCKNKKIAKLKYLIKKSLLKLWKTAKRRRKRKQPRKRKIIWKTNYSAQKLRTSFKYVLNWHVWFRNRIFRFRVDLILFWSKVFTHRFWSETEKEWWINVYTELL